MTQSWKLRYATLFIGIMCSATAFGTTLVPPPGPEEIERRTQMREWQSDVVDGLIETGDVDALFTAAILLPRPVGWYIDLEADQSAALQDLAQRRLRLLDQAAKLEPQSADIASTAMHVCRGLEGCDIGAYAERLHQAEPDGAAWLVPALHAANEQQDSETTTRIMRRMGQASVFDSYYGASTQRIHRAVTRIDLPPMPMLAMAMNNADALHNLPPEVLESTRVSVYATVRFMIYAMPAYAELVQACKPDQPEFEARRTACRSIGMALSHASSILDNRIGLALRRFAATGTDALSTVRAETRALDWLMHTSTGVRQTTNAVAFSRAVLKYGSEAEAMTAMVAAAGLPVTPPPGWVSPREMRDARQAQTQAKAQATITEPTTVGACHDSHRRENQ